MRPTIDGVSMQQGFMSQGGMISIYLDFPMSPDMVSEVKGTILQLTAPEFGASTLSDLTRTPSGGSVFHGAAFDCHRDDSLSATQWGISEKPTFKRDNFGANIGGPAQAARLWNDSWERAISSSISRAIGRKGGSNFSNNFYSFYAIVRR